MTLTFLKKNGILLLLSETMDRPNLVFFPSGCWQRGWGSRANVLVTYGNEDNYYSRINFFIVVVCHKQRFIHLNEDTKEH